MRTSPPLLASLAMVALGVVVGCNSPSVSEGGETGADPGMVEMGAESKPAAGSEAAPMQEGKSDLRAQKVSALVSGFLADAKAAVERGEYETARQQLTHAYELDPGNQEVNDLMRQVSLLLGERGASAGEVAQSAEDSARVRRTQARLEVENKVTESDRLRKEGDLDGALRALEDALLVLRWNPYLSGGMDDGGVTEAQLRDRIASLRGDRANAERELEAQRQRIALAEQQEREREERERTDNLIKTFLRKANDAFYRERFKESIAFCDRVLEIDPNSAKATELRQVALDAQHASLERQYSSDFRYHWRELFDELEYDDLPATDLITFPETSEWERVTRRGPLQFAVGTEAVSPEDQAINNILDTQNVEMNFSDTALEDAIEFFRVSTGANFIIDPLVLDEAADVTFDLRVAPQPARKALDLLVNFSDVEIGYRVEDGVVYIVSAAEPGGGQVLEFYDVRDLTKTISSFPSRDFNLQPSGTFDDFEDDEIEPAPIVIDPDALSDLIRSNIEPDSWDADPNNTINYISGALVIRQTPGVHRKIDNLLSDLRKNSGTMVNIESRFLELQDRFLEDIGVDWRGLDGQNGSTETAPVPNVIMDDSGIPGAGGVGSPGFPEGIGTGNDAGVYFTDRGGKLDMRGRLENLYDQALGDQDFNGSGGLALEWTYLDDTQLEAILRAVQKSSQAEIVKAQNLTVFNGQRANIVNQDHITYLKDFEVEIAQGAVIADPVIDVLVDGTILDVRPVVSADRRFVTMEVRPTVANLIQPIQLFRTSLAIGNEVEIMLPEMEIQRVRTTVTMPDGATLMLGGMKSIVETRLESGTPFLSDIPIVSFFFSRTGTEKSKERLLILVRAKIIIPEESEPFSSR